MRSLAYSVLRPLPSAGELKPWSVPLSSCSCVPIEPISAIWRKSYWSSTVPVNPGGGGAKSTGSLCSETRSGRPIGSEPRGCPIPRLQTTARGASALVSLSWRQTTRCWLVTPLALQRSSGSSPNRTLSLPFVASSWSPRPSGEQTSRISRSPRSIFTDSNPYLHCSFTKARMTPSFGSRTSGNTRSRCLTPSFVSSTVGGTSSIRTPSPSWWPTFEASLVLRQPRGQGADASTAEVACNERHCRAFARRLAPRCNRRAMADFASLRPAVNSNVRQHRR